MDDPHRLDQLDTVSGLHDQRLETLANAVEDLTALLARAVARITALEGEVAQLQATLQHDQKRRK
jgi:uncharacterized coiled-coil protein SlyX